MTESPSPGPMDNAGNGAGSSADETLGGYMEHHSRPPAFEGPEGFPYTVSIEIEKTPDLEAPFSGYLVFPRWAASGAGIVGHVETPSLLQGKSREEVAARLVSLTLLEVQDLLYSAVRDRQEET